MKRSEFPEPSVSALAAFRRPIGRDRETIELELAGPIKPYVRMTQKSKFVDPQAKEYLASKDALQWEMKQQLLEVKWNMIPRGKPLTARIMIHNTRHNCDLDNLIKALLDAAQGIIFEDDRWVDTIHAWRIDRGEDGAWLQVTT